MDEIVSHVGRKNNCTFCGVFRRQALDRGATLLNANKIVTGHNADDIAETVLMNILRGDIARLQRCTSITTGDDSSLPRCKPFKYTYEKEIVMYAYFKKLDYFSTECIYSPNAYRGHARTFLKDLESIRPSCILDIIHSGECMSVKQGVKMPTQGACPKCGYISSQTLCKACVLLEGLNRGLPRLGIGRMQRGKSKALLDSVMNDSLSTNSSVTPFSSNNSLSSEPSTASEEQSLSDISNIRERSGDDKCEEIVKKVEILGI